MVGTDANRLAGRKRTITRAIGYCYRGYTATTTSPASTTTTTTTTVRSASVQRKGSPTVHDCIQQGALPYEEMLSCDIFATRPNDSDK